MKKPRGQITEPIEFEERKREVFATFKNKGRVSEFVYNCYRDLLEIRPGHSLKYPVRLEKYIVEKRK